MRTSRKSATAALLAALALAGCSARPADDAYGTLDALGAGRPRAGLVRYYTAHDGDFTPAQLSDIHSAVDEVRRASGCDVRWAGLAPWQSGPEQPANHVVFEKRMTWTGTFWASGYGWPGNDGAGSPSAGVVFVGPTNDILRSPSEPSAWSGPTFRGVALHEATHALLGLADMYDLDDGHPGLLMGTGYRTSNTYGAGDLRGAREHGCR